METIQNIAIATPFVIGAAFLCLKYIVPKALEILLETQGCEGLDNYKPSN